MMLEVGKLYSCSGYFLILFPDKETAAAAATASAAAAVPAAAALLDAAWNRKHGKSVSYSDPKTPLLVLSVKEEYVEVLVGDKRGWIIYRDWLNIGEISCT